MSKIAHVHRDTQAVALFSAGLGALALSALGPGATWIFEVHVAAALLGFALAAGVGLVIDFARALLAPDSEDP